jgi:2-dehydro-3-deoxygalactonokinase
MRPAHVVVDWGTSSFRLWALDSDGRVLAERRSQEGLAASGERGFETVLDSHLVALGVPDDVPVMMCGMVGSRTGWVEATYLDAPIELDGLVARTTIVPSSRRIHILPGVGQRHGSGPDVMRGEETQLLAVIGNAGEGGLVCLPGTHSKWVRLHGRAVAGFSTFMTGELFHLLRTASVIAPAVADAPDVDPASDGFAAGVADALESPALIGNQLFALRADWLLNGVAADASLARLSGALVGLDLTGPSARYGTLSRATLIAAGATAALYATALRIAGATDVAVLDAEDCVRRGLYVAALAVFGQGRAA